MTLTWKSQLLLSPYHLRWTYMSRPFEPWADDSVYELYPIPTVKKCTTKMVWVPERLYCLVLKHFYQSRYDDAVCTHFKVYPKPLDLSREVYPILCVSRLFRNISMSASFGSLPPASQTLSAAKGDTHDLQMSKLDILLLTERW